MRIPAKTHGTERDSVSEIHDRLDVRTCNRSPAKQTRMTLCREGREPPVKRLWRKVEKNLKLFQKGRLRLKGLQERPQPNCEATFHSEETPTASCEAGCRKTIGRTLEFINVSGQEFRAAAAGWSGPVLFQPIFDFSFLAGFIEKGSVAVELTGFADQLHAKDRC